MIFTQARSCPRKKRYNYTIYWNSKELPSLVREDGSCHHHEYNKTKKNNSYNDVTVPVDNSEKLKKGWKNRTIYLDLAREQQISLEHERTAASIITDSSGTTMHNHAANLQKLEIKAKII